MMHLGQHMEARFFLNSLLNLWATTSEFHGSGGFRCVVYNWKLTCFPSQSLGVLHDCIIVQASSSQPFPHVPNSFWLMKMFLSAPSLLAPAFQTWSSSAMGSCYCTHHPSITPSPPHHSFQEAFFLSHVLCFLVQVFVVTLSPIS